MLNLNFFWLTRTAREDRRGGGGARGREGGKEEGGEEEKEEKRRRMRRGEEGRRGKVRRILLILQTKKSQLALNVLANCLFPIINNSERRLVSPILGIWEL
jgi:hypothetical protein